MNVKHSTAAIAAAVTCAIGLATAGIYAQGRGGGGPLADSALDRSLTDECGGRSANPTEACPNDVARMVAALPATAPAKPAQPRKVLVLGTSRGFQHSSIPLAAKMIEEMGKKTGAWTTDVTYHAGAINAANLAQYDAVFLASTTGTFLDEPNPFNDPAVQAVTDARRKALLDFVRGGKGLAGIHAASDSYHGNPPGQARAGGAGRGGGRAGGAPPAPCTASQDAGAAAGGQPLWPEFNKMIGGFFKFHWLDPQPIRSKIDDKASPITSMFNGQYFDVYDEVYTFNSTRSRARTSTC